MRVVAQRVSRASVMVDHEVVASIGPGLCVLVGVDGNDDSRDAEVMADKIAGLRVFPDAAGKMNHSLLQVGGEALIVSQFTLLADARRGRRPSYIAAADPGHATTTIDHLVARLTGQGIPTVTGVFGARMTVELVNDGPVTLVLDMRQGVVV
jgi:D-tyrosyl-tRNA(Tyr) deacylase